MSRNKPTESYEPFRALWIAVLSRMVQDFLGPYSAQAPDAKRHAEHWANLRNPDFHNVCIMAGFDPSYVMSRMNAAKKKGVKWRAEDGQGSRYAYRQVQKQKNIASVADLTKLTLPKGSTHEDRSI